jgi:coenzyme F420-reducing hydrogenase delta subunit
VTEPRIIGFLCNWCCYAGADLAGVSRIQFPPNIRVIRVMCSGRVDPKYVFLALEEGADGVLVGGCHPGDCHYLKGNYQAERNIKAAVKLLERTGIDPKRLRLEWVSAGEGGRFAEVVTQFTEELREMGPLPRDERTMLALKAARDAAGDYRLKELVGHEREVTEEKNVYGEKIPQDRFDEILDKAIDMEFRGKMILQLLRKEPRSVKGLASELDLPPDSVLKTIVELRRRGLVGMDSIRERSPLYVAMEVSG